jgi:ABC-type sulfate transport system permease subunit
MDEQAQLEMMQQMQTQQSEGPGLLFVIIYLGIVALMIASMWKIFSKAGEPGWASIVPIYNTIVLLKIAGKPVWWFLLMFIPLVNIVVALLATVALAKAFGKGAGFALGLIFLPFVFMPMLAFGDAQYEGAAQPALA